MDTQAASLPNRLTPFPMFKGESLVSLWPQGTVALSEEGVSCRKWRSLIGGKFSVGLCGLSPSRALVGIQRGSGISSASVLGKKKLPEEDEQDGAIEAYMVHTPHTNTKF